MAKRCKIGPRLLLITNRKLHTGFQMIYKSMTLDDLEVFHMQMWYACNDSWNPCLILLVVHVL